MIMETSVARSKAPGKPLPALKTLCEGIARSTENGERVGYESPSQFSREYKRQFGAPPQRDVESLRRQAGAW
jgi:AraC-like DNA-binding protein